MDDYTNIEEPSLVTFETNTPKVTKLFQNQLIRSSLVLRNDLLDDSWKSPCDNRERISVRSPKMMIKKFLQITQIDHKLKNLNIFPTDILINPQLIKLDLSQNNLKILPDLTPLAQLQTLILTSNKIKQLPQLPKSLLYLYVEYNLVEKCPIHKLKILCIQGNPIFELCMIDTLEEFGLDWVKYFGWKEIITGQYLVQIKLWLTNTEQKTFTNLMRHFFGNYVDFRRVDAIGRTIIHTAAMNQDLGIIISLKNLVNINLNDLSKCTPLQLAIKYERLQSVKKLIQFGASLNEGKLVIMAVEQQNARILKHLFKQGCDPNQADDNGNTSLHLIFTDWNKFLNPIRILNLLLKYGACQNLLNRQGLSAFHLAIVKNNIFAVQFALNYRMRQQSVNRCNHAFDIFQNALNGLSPIQISLTNNKTFIFQTLLEKYDEYYYFNSKNHSNRIQKIIQKHNIRIINQTFNNKQPEIQDQSYCFNKAGRNLHQTSNPTIQIQNIEKYGTTEFSMDSDEELIGGIQNNLEYHDFHNPSNRQVAPYDKNNDRWHNIAQYTSNIVDEYYRQFIQLDSYLEKAQIMSVLLKIELQLQDQSREIFKKNYINTNVRQRINDLNSIENMSLISSVGSLVQEENKCIKTNTFLYLKQSSIKSKDTETYIDYYLEDYNRNLIIEYMIPFLDDIKSNNMILLFEYFQKTQ
ncbi:hypothetical protein pb186bvf_002409 [Paramecium bursaria]